jgi:hypothetical protein
LKQVDLSLGYTRNQDLGDGRPGALVAPPSSPTVIPGFIYAQTFPLHFSSPQARISWQLHAKVRANIGYQYYNYTEQFASRQNYHAHTGFVSLLWAF